MEKLLEIRNLAVDYCTDDGVVHAVNGVDLDMDAGDTLGLVGETGAGKTTTALSILRLIADPPGKQVSGEILFEGRALSKASQAELRRIRGSQISMIFQDPMTALNPVLTVGAQIEEVIRLHKKCARDEARLEAMRMLETVGIPGDRLGDYPHQFSGGMKQRVVIAIALACTPRLLIADEPTTALDVTIQAQVLKMIRELKDQFQTSMLLITHDLGVVAEICSRVAIMYAGQIVEQGSLDQIFRRPAHPYTRGLFASIPSLKGRVRRLQPIEGLMPDPMELPEGCKFHPRCGNCMEACRLAAPTVIETEPGHRVRCHLYGKEARP